MQSKEYDKKGGKIPPIFQGHFKAKNVARKETRVQSETVLYCMLYVLAPSGCPYLKSRPASSWSVSTTVQLLPYGLLLSLFLLSPSHSSGFCVTSVLKPWSKWKDWGESYMHGLYTSEVKVENDNPEWHKRKFSLVNQQLVIQSFTTLVLTCSWTLDVLFLIAGRRYSYVL